MTNTDLWDCLGKTDPKHTKAFQRAGGFKGTAIKPIYSYRRMTEEFGPCGQGWGINEPTFQVVQGHDGEVLVYCTTSIWHGARENVVFGVGGDKAVVKQSSGLRGDDEAFKKAFTDAITNALKSIGVGADVHMGLFDDSKYVASLKEEFSEEDAPKPAAAKPAAKAEPQKQSIMPDDFSARVEFMVECREAIAEFYDAEKLAAWWKSDEQMAARRKHQLDSNQVDALKQAVINRRDAIAKKAAA
jgi:hypothetical protein